MRTYHPEPEVNAEIIADAIAAETTDLKAGYQPRWWACPICNRAHNRGHHLTIGTHRCLACGYEGAGGTMHINDPRPYQENVQGAATAEESR